MKEIGYHPGMTIRQTASSALENVGRRWEDVTGIQLRITAQYESSYLWDHQTGEVTEDDIDLVLNYHAMNGEKWGGHGVDDNAFELTLWLDDVILMFSSGFDQGVYTRCIATSVVPPTRYEYSPAALAGIR